MKLHNVIVRTAVAHAGMTVREVFRECVRTHLPALPYCDAAGQVQGRVTLKQVMKSSCLPEYMIELAHLLGPQMSCLDAAEAKARQVLDSPIEPFVLEAPETIGSDAPLVAALALMEQHDTSYLFVVDDGRYRGTVTIQGIAQRMLQVDEARAS
jgi:predicted transcriptional regulator